MDINRRVELFKQGYWEVPEGLDTSGFDFNWRPDPFDRPYIHQFGTQWQKTGGPRFVIPENEGIKYQTHQHAIRLPARESRNWRPLKPNVSIDWSWHPDDNDPPYIYVFGNQWYDVDTMPTIQYRVKGATEKKYITDVRARLEPCMDRWIVPADIADTFDYSWVPHPDEPPLIWQFGTQHQKNGGPRYIPDGATLVKYSNLLQATKINNPANRNWRIIESIDVDTFDFSWHPDETEEPYTYIFGNEYHTSEFMPTVMYRVQGASEVKYIKDVKAKLEIDKASFVDSIFDAVMEQRFDTRYVHFQNSEHPTDYKMFIPKYDPEKQYIHIIDNNSAIVPKGIKQHLFDKLTDYPYVIKHDCGTYQKPLDIIFFSNGESCAEENYQRLVDMKLPNRLVRVDGVNGRVNSQRAAAMASETPWYFLINAKLKVDENFDFNWQPDIMKSRRHYIFRAKNPINGLVYGHMAMVANNKKLTLETEGKGLDFTMEKPHEIVHILSGEAVFNSEWDVWRTSFRESIKLCHATDEQSKERLRIWTTVAEGDFAQSCLQGAKDAVEYYESVNGDFEKLKLSYDWAWLREKFNK
jgi:hypothetical protein